MESVSSMVQKNTWERVGITVRPGKTITNPVLKEIFQFLLDNDCKVYFSGISGKYLPKGIETCSLESLDVDLLITIGGDGTVLHTARNIQKDIPIFAVNFGTRGFLAESEPNHVIADLEKIAPRYRETHPEIVGQLKDVA